ncbi:MAG: hydroxypyruvate isomerase family protein [Pseudomonadota bacterium]|nr:hydroxypyruvate isomerase family protein [Pseudomonadota bacterium]
MPRFAANLSLMFTEVPFLERFEAAARAGFRSVEFQFPYAWPAPEIRRRLDANGLDLAMFNLPPGDWDAGERGLAVFPGRCGEFRAALGLGLQYADLLQVRLLHVMAGVPGVHDDRDAARRTYLDNLREAAAMAATRGITLLIEPLNRRDNPGYFLHGCDQAAAVIADAGVDNLRLQFDFYHTQISEGDLATRLEQHFAIIGHVQVAGVPGRHEPDEGEVNYPWLFRLLDAWGYAGQVGCEYRPRGNTVDGLGWLRGVSRLGE